MCGTQHREKQIPPVPLFILFNRSPVYFYLCQCLEMMEFDDFDKSKDILIFIHGFLDNSQGDFGEGLIEGYRERNDHNIIGIDWRNGAVPEYFTHAVPNVKRVGVVAGKALLNMLDHNLDPNKVHIVGHSLGAQMAGIIGNYVKIHSYNKYILKRITALDPALPGFYGKGQEHITKYDAQFVDVLHTDGGFFGAEISTGTADFWANSGFSPQPGCTLMPLAQHACSHSRAWCYFNESILSKKNNLKKFYAVKADSWKDFKKIPACKCDPNIFFGPDGPVNLTGDYYFQTSSNQPFAKDEDGCISELDLKSEERTVDPVPTEADYVFNKGTEILLYQKYMKSSAAHPKIIPVSSKKAAKQRIKSMYH